MRQGYRILDADAHVIEPGGLFERWTEPGALPMDLPSTTPMVPCGDFSLLTDQFEHGFDAPSYLRAMDAQGIDAVVLYPSLGLFVPYLPDLNASESLHACRAYNDWVADYCRTDPARLAAVAIVPLIDPMAAAAETYRAAELGLVGVMIRPNRLYGREPGDPAYEPLYQAAEEAGLVLAVHEGLGLRGPTIGADRFTSFVGQHLCSHPMEQMAAMAGLIVAGVLERHPQLRVAFLESGTGWLPYWLHRMDEHHEWLADTECASLPCRPSEYFERQCVICTDPEDELASWVVSRVGAARVLWASDFPHPDALFPSAADTFIARLQGADGDALATVLWEAPMAFYRLESRFGLHVQR
jgi:predicted TIM-barrel fold metal-dependent hydrolase